MNKWGAHEHVTARLQRLWRGGRLLADRLETSSALFPLRIPLKHPTASELNTQFDAARDWIAALRESSARHGYELEWKTIRHRQLGENRLPVAALVETPEVALAMLRKQAEAKRFDAIAEPVRERFPELLDWLSRKPLKALEHADDWPRLLAILDWLRAHPRPGCYLRQIDLPGVHTKFIETRRALLSELLDIVLPADAIDLAAVGARQFERRYGFLAKPPLIRFRLLDPGQRIAGLTDLSIPLADFRRLDPPARRVFITENDINGLAFPALADSLVIFGLGYGLDALRDIPWLARRELYYWGDIDTHGFAMLDQLRGRHPHARSLLMDEAT
ncbi:MAG TPA: hypothetical protein ENK26_04645, partial [Gammaproteobacteria bacterium]|nr:hypothetical protein [Gammaproteobacteria bacterium]